MASVNLDPTVEQSDIIDEFGKGETLAVQAGAGSGKTTTIMMMADTVGLGGSSPRRSGMYWAFNRPIVEEAKRKMPRHVEARTVHSVAYGHLDDDLKDRLDRSSQKRMTAPTIAKIVGAKPLAVEVDGATKVVQPSTLASLTIAGISSFCQSDAAAPNRRHVPYVKGIDMPKEDGRRTFKNNRIVAEAVEDLMDTAWRDLNNMDGRLRFRHEYYLKQFELRRKDLGADFIFFDEAQDVSEVLASIVFTQGGFGSQLVLVGDPHQAIYEWLGAVNAFDRIPDEVARLPLTESFRFGPEIAEVANYLLADLGADMKIVGAGSPKSRVGHVTEPDAILCRTNAKAMEKVIELHADGHRVCLLGGGKQVRRFAYAAKSLLAGKHTNHEELSCFGSWKEVREYVDHDELGVELRMLVSLVDKYGTKKILAATEGLPDKERSGYVVVSTAHKAKGKEWGKVVLAEDFTAGSKDKPAPDEELRLMYVAATRACRVLDVSAVPYFQNAGFAE